MGLTPRSLAYERAVEQPAPGVEESWFRRTLLTIGGFYSRESRLIRGAKVLYTDVVEQATNKNFYKGKSMLISLLTSYNLRHLCSTAKPLTATACCSEHASLHPIAHVLACM